MPHTEVYFCIQKCTHISNEFPVQPAKPETPKAGSPSKLNLLAKLTQTVVYGCIQRLSSETGWPPPQFITNLEVDSVAIPSYLPFWGMDGCLLDVLYYSLLYRIIQYHQVLQCIILLYYTILYCTILYYNGQCSF